MRTVRGIAAAVVVFAAAFVLALAGCAPSPTASPSAASQTSPVSSTPTGTASAVPTSAPATPPSQTDTEWGRIWDGIPPSFPVPPGAARGEEPVEPVSAALDITGVDAGKPVDVAQFYADALQSMEFFPGTEGPLEDGSYVVNAVRGPTCDVQVRVGPLGSLVRVTILYGAGCPFE